ncbi:MAG TPA: HAD family hydrolase [Cellulomonas sp.]
MDPALAPAPASADAHALDDAPVAGRRAVFLDVDGTYADRGVVPPGHVRAVRAARAAGHRVLLCTGRPKAMLPPHIVEAGFDGIVASAGGYVEVDGQVLVDLRFPVDLGARLVAELDRHDAAYLLEAPDALYGRPGVDRRLGELLAGHLRTPEEQGDRARSDMFRMLRMSDDLSQASFAKVTYFGSRAPWPVIQDAVGDAISILPSSISSMGDLAGEISMAGVHKARGIEAVCAHLGLGREDVVAFGDGLNDLEMLAYAGTGVAIAGADARVLAVADRVAAGPESEGLAAAFVELALV